jgi:membrane protein implicated in regulation of membrane protease activity
VKPKRDLIVTNVLALLVLLVALLIGWWEAAAFGLAVLAILDLMVLIRGRQARSEDEPGE